MKISVFNSRACRAGCVYSVRERERDLETVNALALCAPLCSSFPGYSTLKCPHSRLSNPAVLHCPPPHPFMPTNISVVTVSFIKSFFLSSPAISESDPEQLCWVFCLWGEFIDSPTVATAHLPERVSSLILTCE